MNSNRYYVPCARFSKQLGVRSTIWPDSEYEARVLLCYLSISTVRQTHYVKCLPKLLCKTRLLNINETFQLEASKAYKMCSYVR